MNKQLLSILVCPMCKGNLDYDKSAQELICHLDKLAYPIEDDIPIMLIDRARKLDQNDTAKVQNDE
ncbi:MAG: Trm112 family protein [Pseudomonadota bacterium]